MTNERTNGRTNGGEIKGPFGFHPGPKIETKLSFFELFAIFMEVNYSKIGHSLIIFFLLVEIFLKKYFWTFRHNFFWI